MKIFNLIITTANAEKKTRDLLDRDIVDIQRRKMLSMNRSVRLATTFGATFVM